MVLELKRINFLLFIISLAYVFSIYQFVAFTPVGIIIYALLFMISFIFSFLVTDKSAIITYLFLLMTFRGIGLIYTLPEDEDALRMMAGYYLLHGLNPYLPMPTVFSHYYVPVGLRTLTEYGGFVERLIYPGLSVFAGVVEYELGYVIYNAIIYFATILITYYYLRNSFSESVIFSVLWLLFGGANLSTLLLTLGILLKRYNGFFVGLAISYNQLYVLIAPFLIIHYYFTGKRVLLLKQIIYAISGFLITNLPFMVWNFKLWFSAMLYSISQPIIPIGFSISRETLLGFFIIPFSVYEYTFIALYIISIIFYALLYKTVVKWTYLFPAISMIAYPRTLLGYITSWVLPAFFFYYSRGEEVNVTNINRIKTAVLITILIAPIFTPLFVHANMDTPFKFRVEKVYVGNYGNVYKMTVNITVYSKNVKNITFVVVPDFYPFYNTYLWWSTVNVTQGNNYANITPLSPSQEIGFVNASYTVIGVYGSYYYFQTLILIQNSTEFSNFTYVPNNNT